MAIKQMYDILETGYEFTDVQFTNVGTDTIDLTTRLFYEDGLVIRHEGGDTLVADDYVLSDLDQPLTNLFGKNVYKKLVISNIAYQTGVVSVDFTGVGDMMLSTDMQELQDQVNTKLDVTSGGSIEGSITTRDILPNMIGATNEVSVRNIGSPTQKFNSVYADEVFVGANSLYVNGKKAIADDSETMTFQTDLDQGLTVKTTSTTPGSGNGNLSIQSDNEVNVIGKGGVEITVPTGLSNKNLTISNSSTNGQVQISSSDEVDITATTIDLNGTTQAVDLIVNGNLTVNGTTTTLDTQTVQIEDNIIELNKNQVGTPAESLKSGIEVNRGDSIAYRFIFSEDTDTFMIGEQNAEQAVATRQATPTVDGLAYWNDVAKRFDTFNGLTFDGTELSIPSLFASTSAEIDGTLRTGAEIRLRGTDVGDTNYGIIAFYDSAEAIRYGYIGDASGDNNNFYVRAEQGNLYLSAGGTTSLMLERDGGNASFTTSVSTGGDFVKGTARATMAYSGTTFPTGIGLGDECYRTDLDEWYKYNGSVWTQI